MWQKPNKIKQTIITLPKHHWVHFVLTMYGWALGLSFSVVYKPSETLLTNTSFISWRKWILFISPLSTGTPIWCRPYFKKNLLLKNLCWEINRNAEKILFTSRTVVHNLWVVTPWLNDPSTGITHQVFFMPNIYLHYDSWQWPNYSYEVATK